MLDTLFHALVRWLAPVLVFTTEEVWGTRYPDGGSVHLLEWPEICRDVPRGRRAAGPQLRELRAQVTEAIEPLRRDKVIGSSLEAEVTRARAARQPDPRLLAELFIISSVRRGRCTGRCAEDRQSQMRALLALPAGSDGGRRALRPLRGCA